MTRAKVKGFVLEGICQSNDNSQKITLKAAHMFSDLAYSITDLFIKVPHFSDLLHLVYFSVNRLY